MKRDGMVKGHRSRHRAAQNPQLTNNGQRDEGGDEGMAGFGPIDDAVLPLRWSYSYCWPVASGRPSDRHPAP
jgi:hypothetical protein